MEEYHRDFLRRVLANCNEQDDKEFLDTQFFFEQLLFLRNEAQNALKVYNRDLRFLTKLRTDSIWQGQTIPKHINVVRIQAWKRQLDLIFRHEEHTSKLQVLVQHFCRHSWKEQQSNTVACEVCQKVREPGSKDEH
jgi:hypothetical protein